MCVLTKNVICFKDKVVSRSDEVQCILYEVGRHYRSRFLCAIPAVAQSEKSLFYAAKFAEMLAVGSPLCIELVFSEQNASLITMSPEWEALWHARDQLITHQGVKRIFQFLKVQLNQAKQTSNKRKENELETHASAVLSPQWWSLLALLHIALGIPTPCKGPDLREAHDALAYLADQVANQAVDDQRQHTAHQVIEHWVYCVRMTDLFFSAQAINY